ncbi:MAG: hypothetical protein C5B50_20040 [Verrucomicrobia bacterium]|nr:MAG: hypothetical protein C5B50_20040 [Verrucomicrobiota bacterium]
MNESERAELERLKLRQAQLESDLRALSREITTLGLRLDQEVQSPKEFQSPRSKVQSPIVEQPTPVSGGSEPPPESVSGQWSVVGDHSEPPPLPPIIPEAVPVGLAFSRREPEREEAQHAGESPGRAGHPALPGLAVPTSKPSFEMRLGTYWLVRIGIVMVLTGLVFFGNLAYHNYISKLGPGGKLALLYVASGLLLGAGAWWQRRAAKESLKNYAQVLFAGGLAAVYFTTYAAYHIAQLRVIESAAVDGLLLLGWAAFMVWIADRKKSEVLALFAVGLAYYTSIITHVGSFTLWSNLVLTSAAVVFLLRNRWAALSFASLLASYASYAFWRFFDGESWHWATPEQGLWTGALFLMSYWLVFTVAVFASRGEKFAGQNRIAFLTFNNGAFFSLFLLTMLQVQTGGFWKFCLVYGSVLLVLAVAATRILASEPLARNFYLTQGLLLITVGFITEFAGLKLALILATESVILLMVGSLRRNLVLLTGAYLSAGLSVGWGMDGMKQFDSSSLWLGVGLGVLMVWLEPSAALPLPFVRGKGPKGRGSG